MLIDSPVVHGRTLIQTTGVERTSVGQTLALVLATAGAFLLSGCFHSDEVHPMLQTGPTVPFEPAPFSAAPPEPLPVEAPPAAPPRLSHTVTLGEESASMGEYVPPPAPPAPGVVVNNNIVVQPAPYGYGYAYGGYGYSGYRGGAARATTSVDGSRSAFTNGAQRQWGASGWEGAGRSAAPGRTPNVGGNWSAPASYGPAQMK
jgi:hypothetical protein